jgi:hypothetical protein
MREIFLSFSFRDEDRPLVAQIERILASHELFPVTGRRLGGAGLTPAIMRRIEDSDGLVSLLTYREPQPGRPPYSQWVWDELQHARQQSKRSIALVEEGVEVGGAFASHEHIPFARTRWTEAIVALSETLGLWRREAGRRLKIQIFPESLAQQVALDVGQMSCSYRFFRDDQYTEWQEAERVARVAGTFIYITGVRDDYLIQLKIEYRGRLWRSFAMSSEHLPVELQEIGG